MKGKRFVVTAALATLLATAGCLRNMCERHGYYPVTPPAACAPQCCVPCGPPAAGYTAPAPAGWNVPAPPAPTCPAGCVAGR